MLCIILADGKILQLGGSIMLYKKNSEKSLSKDLFKNPTAEYRGTPFWALNSYLTKEELCRQIDVFREMGLGGFHMHVRTGLANEYLSKEYLDLIKACVEKAKSNDMLAWLYDEDRWPSGAAGGIVTKDHRYRQRYLVFIPEKLEECERREFIAAYDIELDSKGFLAGYKKIGADENARFDKWYAYKEVSADDSWYNDQAYADTLSKAAIEKFIEVTHERYKKTVGDEFDKVVPAIFTDEPQFQRKRVLNNSFDKERTVLPWTDKVPELYKELYGADILDTLPELFWDLPDGEPSVNRYYYHDFISELFTRSFADTIGGWCEENNIALTGHMMEEPTLHSQTAALGEAMRSYRGFGLPGIDLLCNRHEFTTAKQAQSATHQFGKEGVLSELYGVTGWDCDFRTYKHQGDWQAALGITVRVPHLSWYAMKGEAKRDYPASIHYQSPWYKEYSAIEDHFARVNTALTRGKPVIKVAVIHPVESFWLHWGPNDKSAVLRDSLDEKFDNITKWLLEGSVDFNYISESLFPSLCEKGSFPLKVGKMAYDAVIVPGCETLRSTTVERLKAFREAGGKLIFMGEAPTLVDAKKSNEAKDLYENSVKTDFTRSAILGALEDERTVTLRYGNGKLSTDLIYQLREDNDCRWLFICRDKEPYNKDVDEGNDYRFTVQGEYAVEVYDTQSGEIRAEAAEYINGTTVIKSRLYGYDSVLYRLAPGKSEAVCKTAGNCEFAALGAQLLDYELSEPNVLLLDNAEFKLKGEADFSPAEEILRLDNICRDRCGLRHRSGHIVQPWVTGNVPAISELTLRFRFESEIDYSGAYLAIEDCEDAKIVFNGEAVNNKSNEYYVDIDIDKVALPQIKKGVNELLVTIPFGERSNTENLFILGDFGVKLTGRFAKITEKPAKITFGDLTTQGFPFYGANVTYKFRVETKNGLVMRVSDYRGALIGLKIDGKNEGRIIYPPYIIEDAALADGAHDFELTVFTHRYNTFGPLHLVDVKESWHGPGAWRSEGSNWTYEYVLRPTGVLSTPEMKK